MNNSTEKGFVKLPLKLVSSVLVILLILSFVPTETEIFGIHIKPFDIISDLSNDDSEEYEDEYYEESSESVDDSTYEEVTSAGISFATLSTLAEKIFSDEKESLAPAKKIQGKDVKISGDINQMKHFFDALKNSKNKQVRVAHYGDSAIEGDNITSELRDNLQRKFGGKGLGYLAITSQDIQFRPTITHSFSDTWDNASIFTSNPKKLPVGINGEIFIPKSKSWINYVATSRYRRIKNFNNVKLFYSSGKGSVTYQFDKKKKETANLNPGKDIQVLELKGNRKSKEIKIEFPKANAGNFYGVSLENGPGVYVDNFPLRGNSGVNLNDIKTDILKGFSKHLDYKLIVLYFGLNIAGNKNTKYTWYEREMVKVINKFKRVFPKCSFLIVSVSDKSIKKGRRFITNPSIPKLVKAQENIAKKTKVAFWNLFEAMGGKNSMDRWVKANPKLATSDYTHFTLAGSKKVAKMLAEALINCYEENK